MRARNVLGLAVGLMVAAPLAVGQKMYRCTDGKGGTVFQQERCGESAAEAEARARERQRVEAEARRRKEEEERRKEAAIQKARERDKAYQEQVKERAEAQRKSREAEQRLMQGTSKQKGVDDGTLPAAFAQSHPGAWKEVPNPEIVDFRAVSTQRFHPDLTHPILA